MYVAVFFVPRHASKMTNFGGKGYRIACNHVEIEKNAPHLNFKRYISAVNSII